MEEEEILVVDRIEDNIAVCEVRSNGLMINIQLDILPENVKEGTVLRLADGKFIIDSEEQEKIENRIQEKMNKLWE